MANTFILDSQIKYMSFLVGLILSKIFFWFSNIGFIRFLPFLYGIILVLF